MPVRLGIELSPVACRFVELDSSRRFGRDALDTRVRSFARLPRQGAETHRKLSSCRRQPAAVVVWGLQADHRQALVANGSFNRMRREAVTAIRNAGVETRGRVADITPASRRANGAATRSVVVALAPTQDLAAALRWLTDEGVRVQSIVTPALALMSLARLRRESAVPGPPGTIDAYVALEETTTAVALVRDGALVAACELEWGYQDERGHTRPRGEIASQLADDLERFLAACGARPNAVSLVCVCGGLPELRSMAVMLMEQLDAEVETLDSLFAIDAARLPEPAYEFRDHSAELRLAWAAAADWPAPINLLRERQRRLTKTVLTRAAVVAGVATGVGVAWQVQRSDWWRSTSTSPLPTSPAVSNPPAASAITAPVRRLPAPSPLVPPDAPPVVRQATKPAAAVVVPPPSLPSIRAETRQSQPPSAAVNVPLDRPRPYAARAAQPRGGNQRQLPDRRTATTEPETSLPFDAVLGTILYASERKLAIIDGQIVQVGDAVRDARVVDITPTAVLLRDGQGRLRRLALGASR